MNQNQKPEISFYATNLNTEAKIRTSISSIVSIAEEIGLPWEIVIAEGPSDDGSSEILKEMSSGSDNIIVKFHSTKNRGYGRRVAFENSAGNIIVPFDTSIAYNIRYAKILKKFIELGVDKMMFSEISAIPRKLINSTGGWRDLIGGEDIDLYGRIIHNYNVLAAPIGMMESVPEKSSSFDRQMRYVKGGVLQKLKRIYSVQRDQIIGCNYKVEDLMKLNLKKPLRQRLYLRVFFFFCAMGSKFSKIKPVNMGRNNYLIFREGLFNSFLRNDFKLMDLEESDIKLTLNQNEIEYLNKVSSLWKSNDQKLMEFVKIL